MILRTLHGSHLYGTATSDSDIDWYEVGLIGKNRQGVDENKVDTTFLNLTTFTRQVFEGVPQALEALYSPYKVVNPTWQPFIGSLRPDYRRTLDTFERTVRNFMGWSYDLRPSTEKRRMHAIRLAYERASFAKFGSFDPVLPSWAADMFQRQAATEESAEQAVEWYGVYR